MNLLKKGSKGDDVVTLQLVLGVAADGVFGAQTEAQVKAWQKDHDLDADGIVGPLTWKAMFDSSHIENLNILYKPINVHISKKPGRKIKYLVIHYTAGASSAKGAAEKNRNVFLNREASADFCVDDDTIIQVNPDPRNFYCWAVGDGKGKYGINNSDCISIEICSNLKKGTTAKVPNHEGWYFTDEAVNKAIALSRYIMAVYGIPEENVIRHYDVTRKLCPGILGWNPGTIYNASTSEKTSEKNTEEKWKWFKQQLVNTNN